jgi:hypothetical protein
VKETLESNNDVITKALKANIENLLAGGKTSKERRRYPKLRLYGKTDGHWTIVRNTNTE